MAMDDENKDALSASEEMAVYQKFGTPGEPHRLLASMAGNWQTRTRHWMEPGNPPVTSEGTCEQHMILDGRFLYQEFKGEMMGAPFTGIGINGYDNHSGKYVSTWIDSMGTAIYYFEGTADADGRSITQTCDVDDPIRGPITWRSVTKIADDATHSFEMYSIDQAGKEQKVMEMTYIRR